ncbi:hypothetical protein PILCRDRAFT_8644 [Piloderma croceum F 1598]|uniref:Uncharacterized protein n=1 Tax=Piloderma croceum (strain F 1598) TaxID=765440 RepID=A0A0C3B5W7_PILCF|nr:hypothetical protein PILCRDRAFT_8644 [Piloderma croceum F 1598]
MANRAKGVRTGNAIKPTVEGSLDVVELDIYCHIEQSGYQHTLKNLDTSLSVFWRSIGIARKCSSTGKQGHIDV